MVSVSDLQSDNSSSILGTGQPSLSTPGSHKLLAVSRGLVTTVEECEGKTCGRKMDGLKTMLLDIERVVSSIRALTRDGAGS